MIKRVYKKCLPILAFVFLLWPLSLVAQGHLEFGFHSSSWSLDVLKPLIEEGLNAMVENSLKDEIINIILEDRPRIEEIKYKQDITFDSGGNNWGFEVRWYPGGQKGSFSLGLSIEKSTMWVSLPHLAVNLTLFDTDSGKTGNFKGDASGANFEMKPLSYHLHMRWDIVPRWKIRPFITFGLGLAGTNGVLKNSMLDISFRGTVTIEGEKPNVYDEAVTKTLQEIKDDGEAEGVDFLFPPVLPFIQFNLGLKGEITPNLYLIFETGIFNGFILRWGISARI
ncbi:MAG: hypothetical protein MUP98_19440 [Candidatus Aminicenantes bacterium]|nr:hypothetical protein [Candidatus Aminicenantes bacterium]